MLDKRFLQHGVVFLRFPPRARDSQNGETDNQNKYKTGKEFPKRAVKKLEHLGKYNSMIHCVIHNRDKTPPYGGVLEV